jgi:hypothetical protein
MQEIDIMLVPDELLNNREWKNPNNTRLTEDDFNNDIICLRVSTDEPAETLKAYGNIYKYYANNGFDERTKTTELFLWNKNPLEINNQSQVLTNSD